MTQSDWQKSPNRTIAKEARMKITNQYLAIATLLLASTACSVSPQNGTTASSNQERLIFRCTLDQADSRSISITETEGFISIAPSRWGKIAVVKTVDSSTQKRSYRFVKGWIDYDNNVPLTDLTLHIGKGNATDSISFGDRTVNCRYKATINSAVLDSLAEATSTVPSLRALVAGESYGLCKETGEWSSAYGMVALEQRLADGRWLFAMFCDLGAYQGTYQMVLWNDETREGTIASAQMYDYETKAIEKTDYLFGNPYFDEATGSLATFAKGRGIGDCGMYTAFNPMEDDRFLVREIRAKDACDGVYIPFEEWPVIYTAPSTSESENAPAAPKLEGVYRNASGVELRFGHGLATFYVPSSRSVFQGRLERDGSLGAAYNIRFPEGFVCGNYHVSLFTAEGEVGDGKTLKVTWDQPQGSVVHECDFMAALEGEFTR
jgi:Protein of unknown function (DUF1176)